MYFPIYGQNTAEFIASRYKPMQGNLSIREKIKLDIDILIYSSENADDLFEKMKEHGFEIKRGKYISVKHPTAERFVRLKTLGEEYLTENLTMCIDAICSCEWSIYI